MGWNLFCGVFSFIVTLPQLAFVQNLCQWRYPVSDSTATAVVTEIDEDSAFTEARETLDARVPMLVVCEWS